MSRRNITTLQQAFLKWWRNSPDEQRKKAGSIGEVLEPAKPKAPVTPQPRHAKGAAQGPRSDNRRAKHGAPSPSSKDRKRSAETQRSLNVKIEGGAPPKPAARKPNRSDPAEGSAARPGYVYHSGKWWREVQNLPPEPPGISLEPEFVPADDRISHQPGLSTSSPARNPSVTSGEPRGIVGGLRRATKILRFQIGLDFGTTTTKVTYQQLGVPERKTVPITFAHGLPAYPDYCLPSLAVIDRAGNLHLADSAARRMPDRAYSSGLSRFKMLVAGLQDARYLDERYYGRYQEYVRAGFGDLTLCTPERLMATYVARVMRRVRRELEERHRGAELDLSFNMCVPADQVENRSVVSAFRRVLLTAELLERDGDDRASARRWLERLPELEQNVESVSSRDIRSFVVPEAIAGIAAYSMSLQLETGINALVDIGGGTTDVSILHIVRTKEKGVTVEVFASRSIPMAAGHAEAWVAWKLAQRRDPSSITRAMVLDALTGRGELANECRDVIHEVLTTVWNRTSKVWGDAYKRMARESCWRGDNVNVFMAGGGGLIPRAATVFAESWMKNWGPYRCRPLPAPAGFAKAFPGVAFGRISVAYGLATPLPEMAYLMPAEVADQTPPPPPLRPMVSSGDQLVPQPGWLRRPPSGRST